MNCLVKQVSHAELYIRHHIASIKAPK